MKNINALLGIVLLVLGLLDMVVMPSILRRMMTTQSPQFTLVLRALWASGLFMVIVGVLFLMRVIALP